MAAALALMVNGENPLLLKDTVRPTEFCNSHAGPRQGRDRWEGRDDVRSGRPRDGREHCEELETFRVEVGHMNQVKPANLVGAIANEVGIDGSRIGRIAIYHNLSTVNLPVGMPHTMFHELKKVRVAGQPLNISRPGDELAGAAVASMSTEGKPKKAKKPKRKAAGSSV